ncbi:MAG TPA: hypothetical protein DEG23_05040 [Coxiellaceae bacterium]|nr:hypothetical protein [Coxiellaceae bacterium]
MKIFMPNSSHPSGFSLLEVLIATFILAFGLLGVTGIYIHSFKRMENSYWHTLAISQLSSMTEQFLVHDYECLVWSKDCRRLLPHGECDCKPDKIRVCWKGEQNKQCLQL